MRKARLIPSLALCAVVATASAKEFPLTYKALTLEEAMALPGGYGAFGSLSTRKPPGLKREPEAISERALYGELGRGRNERGFLFRADESGGTGKGYDRLVLDLNQNGDLTDDPVLKAAESPTSRKAGPTTRELSRYGPIEAPAANMVGAWRPVYFAELNYVRRDTARDLSRLPSTYLGQMRLRAGYYLETTVELDNLKQKIGVVDGNANLRLGDEPKAMTYKRDSEQNWYFVPADAFLRDTDGSGKFENRPHDPESSPFGKIVYLGATPYRVTLLENYTSLRVEPWSDALAELSVQPNGNQVREVLLAWERKPDDWALIKAGVASGRAKVPPGNIRLTGCVVEGNANDGEPLVLCGFYRKMDKTIVARAGQKTTLNCGAPFEARLTAEKQRRSESVLLLGEEKSPSTASGTVLLIQAEIIGAGGETVATFAKGRKLEDEPAQPRFIVRDRDGKQVGSGKLEYG